MLIRGPITVAGSIRVATISTILRTSRSERVLIA